MNWRRLRQLCLSPDGATETFPFEPGVSVFKAPNGKMFAIAIPVADQEPLSVSVKVDPDEGEALRASYEAIVPGYHLNKRHWVTITLGGDAPDALVEDLVRGSYELVNPKRTAKAPAAP